jgi:hypothetical protein
MRKTRMVEIQAGLPDSNPLPLFTMKNGIGCGFLAKSRSRNGK